MKKALASAAKPKHKGKPQGGRGHCTTARFFLQGEAAPCKAPPLQQNPPELENLPHAGPRGKHPPARGRGAPLSQRIARFLYTTPLAGPRGVSLGLHRVGGYRGNEIFFMCVILHALGSPYNANESFFLSAFFGVLGAARGLSWLGVSVPSHAG